MDALELPYPYKRTTGGPDIYWYGPYADVAAANAAVLGEIRRNRTVLIAGVEYWWLGGITDGHLVVKGGSSAGGDNGQLQINSGGSLAGVPNNTPAGFVMTSNGGGVAPTFQPNISNLFVIDDHMMYDNTGILFGREGNINEVRSLFWFTGKANAGYTSENAPFNEVSIFNTWIQLGADNVGDGAYIRGWMFINIASSLVKSYAVIEFTKFYVDDLNDGADEITIVQMGLSYDELMNPINEDGIGHFIYLDAQGDLRYRGKNSMNSVDVLLVENFPAGVHSAKFEFLEISGTLIVYVDGESLYSHSFNDNGYVGGGVPFFSAYNLAGSGHSQMIDRAIIRTVI